MRGGISLAEVLQFLQGAGTLTSSVAILVFLFIIFGPQRNNIKNGNGWLRKLNELYDVHLGPQAHDENGALKWYNKKSTIEAIENSEKHLEELSRGNKETNRHLSELIKIIKTNGRS